MRNDQRFLFSASVLGSTFLALGIAAVSLFGGRAPTDAAVSLQGKVASKAVSNGSVKFSDLPNLKIGQPRGTRALVRRVLPSFNLGRDEITTVPNFEVDESKVSNAVPRASATLVKSRDSIRSSNLEPSDGSIAVGPKDLIVATNAGFQVYNKSLQPIGGIKNLDLFFRVPSTFDVASDPKFFYDANSQRFYGVYIGFSSSANEGGIFISVSATNSIAGVNNLYKITTPGLLPDYPGWGVCDNKVVVTTNNFNGFGPFSDAMAIAINKSGLVTNQSSVDISIFRNLLLKSGAKAFTVQPAIALTPTTTCHLTTLDNSLNNLNLYQITGVPKGTTEAKLVSRPSVKISQLSPPPLAKEKGTTNLVDANDIRLLGAVVRGTNLWTNSVTGCTIGGAKQSCLNLVEVKNITGTPAKNRQAIVGSKGKFYSYPALTSGQGNNVTAVFSSMGTGQFPSLYYLSWLSGKAQPEVPKLFKGGGAAYVGCCTAGTSGNPHRWGDFFGAAVDPSNPASIWIEGQYKPTGPAAQWGTFVGQTKIP